MLLFVAGLLFFFAIHSVSIVAPHWRNAQIDRMGVHAWRGVYSMLSLASLAVLIYGYGVARQAPVFIYSPPMALRHLNWLLMAAVFPLLIASFLPCTIRRATRYPMALALLLWSVAHLLANGTLNDSLLFGSFLVWSVALFLSSLSRTRAQVDLQRGSWLNDGVAIIAGLALYALMVTWLHVRLIGVSPLA